MSELLKEAQEAYNEYEAMTEQERADHDALAARLAAGAHKEHLRLLTLGVRLIVENSQECAEDAHMNLRGALMVLVDGKHAFNDARPPGSTIPGKISTPKTAFADLKRCAKEAFSENPTDEEILANSATPDLVRYLLWALRAYDDEPSNLATAFGAKSRKGTTELWRKRHIFIPAADMEHNKQLLLNAPYAARMQAVVDAAYAKFVSEKKYQILPEAKGKKGSRGEGELRSEILDILSQRYGWG